MRKDYWRMNYVCPFLEAADRTCIQCEGGCLLQFPDGQETKAYMERYCASFGYRACTLAKAKEEYFLRT